MVTYDYPFDPDEPNNTAASIYALARSGGRRVLDVGSGPAVVSRVLAVADEKSVTCLDHDPHALAEAQKAGVQRVLQADLEDPGWHCELRGEAFDVIILADVLEHVRRPADILDSLRTAELLDPSGFLVVSVPNAGHQAVLAELISGDFQYTDTGILDQSHLRWFTLDSLTRMLERSGFFASAVRRTRRTLEQTTHGHRVADLSPTARQLLTELGTEGQTYQYVLQVRPMCEPARVRSLHDQVDDERRRRDQESKLRVAAERQLAQTRQLIEEERRATLAEAAAGAAELTALEHKLERARTRNLGLEKRLERTQQKVDQYEAAGRARGQAGAAGIRRTVRRALRAARNPKRAARVLASRIARR